MMILKEMITISEAWLGGMNSKKFALVCRLPEQTGWSLVSNPIWSSPNAEFYAIYVLSSNPFNEYIEYLNSGVLYRLVPQSVLEQYLSGETPASN